MPDDLDTVLADAAEAARGPYVKPDVADAVLGLIDRVARATEDYRRWLSAADAAFRSARRERYWHDHYGEHAEMGNARTRNGVREFRALIVPQRADTVAARAAGRAGGQRAA